MSLKKRVVVTGMGMVSPIGNNVEESWNAAKKGECGIDEITQFDASMTAVSLAAEVKDFHPEEHLEKKSLRKMDRFVQFAMVAADEALAQAGEFPDKSKVGTIVSSGIGGLRVIEKEQDHGREAGFKRISPYFIPMAISNMAAGQIAIAHGLTGLSTCVVTACASGTNAIGEAFLKIRDGYLSACVCGGTEASITPLALGGFASMKALCTGTDKERASIPFDKERHGFVMGEGAGILVLEEYEHAKARGAHILGEMVGYGTNCDAYHITAPLPDGSGAAECMKLAISDAGITPENIGYINAHGTSTPLNDLGETKAVKLVFGEETKVPISSTKSMTGHLLGASGAVEAIFCLKALENQYLPATIHYKVPDEECNLDVIPNQGREADVTYALSNSLGFGGHNATLIMKRWEEDGNAVR